jgi:hypothetical protein
MSHTQQVLKLTWGQKYMVQAVDMYVGQKAQVNGNGISFCPPETLTIELFILLLFLSVPQPNIECCHAQDGTEIGPRKYLILVTFPPNDSFVFRPTIPASTLSTIGHPAS